MKWTKEKIVSPDIPQDYVGYQKVNAEPVSGGTLQAQAFQRGGIWHCQIIHMGTKDGLTPSRFPRIEEVFSAMKELLPHGLGMMAIFDSGGIDEVDPNEWAGVSLAEIGHFQGKGAVN